jgi:putative FmdB family regulatory protein
MEYNMPNYTYRCENKKCKKEFEMFQKMSESSADVKCPECGKKSKRILVPLDIIIRGKIHKGV